MPPIFLIGFMCSGKTTLGKALAQRLGLEFIDLDHYIEQKSGMTVSEIFAQQGETTFRQLEHDALVEVAGRQDVIVACGGGTPCQPEAMPLMNAAGLTVRLVPSERRLIRRLMSGRHKRPLISAIDSPEEMRDFMIFTAAKREPYYCLAQCRFDTSYLENVEEVDRTVGNFIDMLTDKGFL